MGNIRKSRGYSYEYTLTHWFKRFGESRRLAVNGYPDVLFTVEKNNKHYIYIVEAKTTGQSNYLYIEKDQIDLCFEWLRLFKAYDYQKAIFAFKFGGSKKIRRPIKEYLFECPLEKEKIFDKIKLIRCSYEGVLVTNKGKSLKIGQLILPT